MHKLYNTYLLAFFFILSSCVGTRYLEGDEKVLFKQKIEGNQYISDESLEDLYAQEANRRLLLLPISPYVAFYEIGTDLYDREKVVAKLDTVKSKFNRRIAEAEEKGKPKKKARLQRKLNKKVNRLNKKLTEGNLFMRWGEPLAVYDSSLTKKTRDQMKLYLQSKGFFEAEVDFYTTLKGLSKDRLVVHYQIDEGKPHYIDTIIYNTGGDRSLIPLLLVTKKTSVIKKGQRYDQNDLKLERERIELLLKNKGYYAFSRQFVEFNVYQSPDTTGLTLEVIINKPANEKKHKRYVINKVNFITDVNIREGQGKRTDYLFNGVHYQYYEPQYKKKILDQRVFIRPGDKYSLNNTFNTQRQLGNLDMFKFVNVKYDTVGGDFIANIFTSPLEKYQVSNEVGVNVNVSYGIPGPFYNLSLKNRNPFGGIEILELSGRLGLEGVANLRDETDITTATDARVNLTLTFPHFLMPLGNRLKSQFALLNPKTKTGIGYNYTERPGGYVRSNVNGSFGYSWLDQKNWIYDYTVADLNVIQSRIDSVFNDQLLRLDSTNSRGVQLINSFKPSFVSSSFLNISKNFNNYGTDRQKASFIKFFIETGGNLLNFKGVADLTKESNLVFYQFLKGSVDFRHYFPYGNSSIFAFRINVGAAKSYGGFSDGALPYEKYFFAGGSSSIRAWAPRRLGPGSYANLSEDSTINYSFEQPGEIILETSIELRRKLFSIFDGAFFVDAGNVWNFQSSTSERSAQFRFDRFYKQIAIGTGVGLRMDFSFLVLRLDFGFKVYNPAEPVGKRWTVDQWNLNIGQGSIYSPTLNIGIGYPF